MKISIITRAGLICVLTLLSMPALASYPILTTALVEFTETETCTGPGGGTVIDTGTATISFSGQTGPDDPTFDATISDNLGESYSGSGYFISPTELFISFQGANSFGNYDSFAVTMILSGSSVTFSYSGTEYFDSGFSSPTGCTFTGSGSGTLDSTVVNPGTTAPSTILNNTETLSQTVTTMVTTLSARIQNAFRGKAGLKRVAGGVMYDTGMNAGDDNSSIAGVWGSYSRSNFENDFYRTAYDGNRNMFMGGVDFATADNVIVGVSIAYEDADVDTDFNNGSASSNGFTIAPYVGIVLDDTWNIDISGGMGSLDTDQDRNNGAITSNVDTDRLFASVNLNGFKQIDRWFVTGRIGALYARSEDDSFTESNGTFVASRISKLSQFQLGGEAAYELGEWEPYVGGTYRYDMTATDTELTNTGVAGDQPSNDHSDFMLSAGVRFYSKEGLTMSLGYDKLYGRDDYDEETVMFNARWDF